MRGPNRKLPEVRLPVMPQTAGELRRLLDLRSTRHSQLQDILLADPAALIAVFRELEHARPGASDQVGDAAHAVSLIGVDAFRRLIEGLPVRDSGERPVENASVCAYSSAAHAAVYATAIAERRGLARPEELATAALLQNPAVLALAAAEPESTQRAVNAVRDGVSADVAFGAELGEPLQDANRRLAETWALPALARQALGDWDDFNPRPQVVRLADEIAQTTAIGWYGEHADALTALLGEFLGLEPDQTSSWLHCRSVDAARRLSPFAYPLPGYRLALIPGGDDEDEDDDLPLPASRRVTTATTQAATRTDLNATMGAIMKRIRREVGATRVVFAILNRKRNHLRTRLALGAAGEDGLRHLDLDLGQRHLFSILMGKPQSLWLNSTNAAKYRRYLPEPLHGMLAGADTFMMSLYVGNRPLGLMVGDGNGLDADGYRQFRELCQEATTALTAGSRVMRPAAAGA